MLNGGVRPCAFTAATAQLQGCLEVNRPGCSNGGVGGVTSAIFSKVQESWSKVSHAAGEIVTVFSLTFC